MNAIFWGQASAFQAEESSQIHPQKRVHDDRPGTCLSASSRLKAIALLLSNYIFKPLSPKAAGTLVMLAIRDFGIKLGLDSE